METILRSSTCHQLSPARAALVVGFSWLLMVKAEAEEAGKLSPIDDFEDVRVITALESKARYERVLRL